MNSIKTAMLLALLTALVLFMGQALGGSNGLVMAGLFALIMNFASYWFSDKIALAMHRAKALKEQDQPQLFATVQKLCARMDLPMPKLFIVPERAPNAFATGRNPQNAAVALTAGIMEILDEQELEGVIAHELAHIKNRDTLIMTVAATVAGALSMITNMAMWSAMLGGRSSDDNEGGAHPAAAIAGIVLAPIAAALIQMSISRTREFMADETGARACKNPMALANALLKLENYGRQIPMQTASNATAHLFISSPLRGANFASLFSTHPSTKARVERLQILNKQINSFFA